MVTISAIILVFIPSFKIHIQLDKKQYELHETPILTVQNRGWEKISLAEGYKLQTFKDQQWIDVKVQGKDDAWSGTRKILSLYLSHKESINTVNCTVGRYRIFKNVWDESENKVQFMLKFEIK